jgi:hypothetical protein
VRTGRELGTFDDEASTITWDEMHCTVVLVVGTLSCKLLVNGIKWPTWVSPSSRTVPFWSNEADYFARHRGKSLRVSSFVTEKKKAIVARAVRRILYSGLPVHTE